MQEEFTNPSEEEKIKAENDFLKMKIMLQHGGQFGGTENSDLPPEIENQFLNNIMAFEQQYERHKTIKIFEKIGKPDHFKPVGQIDDSGIEEAWRELRQYMNEHGVDLDACSPNISPRELYRFATEELFDHETDDIDLPGWSTNFIYDEFYPDPVYDNTRVATEDCIKHILEKEPLQWTHHFRDEGLRLNEHFPLTIEEFKAIVNRFKDAYEGLKITEVTAPTCVVNDTESFVEGEYSVSATVGRDSDLLTGSWKVIFQNDQESGYWYITGVHIEGIKF